MLSRPYKAGFSERWVTLGMDLLLDMAKEPGARLLLRNIYESVISRACTISKDDTRVLGGDSC